MKIGITGVIASGKTTVLNRIKELGYKVIDCDIIVKELYEKQNVIDLIKDNFECVRDNKIDKKLLANIIFSNSSDRIKLNNLIHPLIRDYIKNLNDELIFIEVPLLFEAHFEDLFDKIILVYLNNDEALKRLILRNNLTLDEAIKRINSQMPCEKKIELSDYVIDNSNSTIETFIELDKVLGDITNGNKYKR